MTHTVCKSNDKKIENVEVLKVVGMSIEFA